MNLDNGWHHTRGPIIWKEISMRGGKPYLIGGISEFWEYCYDFYGLESALPPSEVQKLVSDNLQVRPDCLSTNLNIYIDDVTVFATSGRRKETDRTER